MIRPRSSLPVLLGLLLLMLAACAGAADAPATDTAATTDGEPVRVVVTTGILGDIVTQVLDAAGHRFGGFATEAWEPAQRYFGTGESFLFRATPSLAVYHWTGANTHFQLGSLDSIAMGGGGLTGGSTEVRPSQPQTGCPSEAGHAHAPPHLGLQAPLPPDSKCVVRLPQEHSLV